MPADGRWDLIRRVKVNISSYELLLHWVTYGFNNSLLTAELSSYTASSLIFSVCT